MAATATAAAAPGVARAARTTSADELDGGSWAHYAGPATAFAARHWVQKQHDAAKRGAAIHALVWTTPTCKRGFVYQLELPLQQGEPPMDELVAMVKQRFAPWAAAHTACATPPPAGRTVSNCSDIASASNNCAMAAAAGGSPTQDELSTLALAATSPVAQPVPRAAARMCSLPSGSYPSAAAAAVGPRSAGDVLREQQQQQQGVGSSSTTTTPQQLPPLAVGGTRPTRPTHARSKSTSTAMTTTGSAVAAVTSGSPLAAGGAVRGALVGTATAPVAATAAAAIAGEVEEAPVKAKVRPWLMRRSAGDALVARRRVTDSVSSSAGAAGVGNPVSGGGLFGFGRSSKAASGSGLSGSPFPSITPPHTLHHTAGGGPSGSMPREWSAHQPPNSTTISNNHTSNTTISNNHTSNGGRSRRSSGASTSSARRFLRNMLACGTGSMGGGPRGSMDSGPNPKEGAAAAVPMQRNGLFDCSLEGREDQRGSDVEAEEDDGYRSDGGDSLFLSPAGAHHVPPASPNTTNGNAAARWTSATTVTSRGGSSASITPRSTRNGSMGGGGVFAAASGVNGGGGLAGAASPRPPVPPSPRATTMRAVSSGTGLAAASATAAAAGVGGGVGGSGGAGQWGGPQRVVRVSAGSVASASTSSSGALPTATATLGALLPYGGGKPAAHTHVAASNSMATHPASRAAAARNTGSNHVPAAANAAHSASSQASPFYGAAVASPLPPATTPRGPPAAVAAAVDHASSQGQHQQHQHQPHQQHQQHQQQGLGASSSCGTMVCAHCGGHNTVLLAPTPSSGGTTSATPTYANHASLATALPLPQQHPQQQRSSQPAGPRVASWRQPEPQRQQQHENQEQEQDTDSSRLQSVVVHDVDGGDYLDQEQDEEEEWAEASHSHEHLEGEHVDAANDAAVQHQQQHGQRARDVGRSGNIGGAAGPSSAGFVSADGRGSSSSGSAGGVGAAATTAGGAAAGRQAGGAGRTKGAIMGVGGWPALGLVRAAVALRSAFQALVVLPAPQPRPQHP